VPVHLEQTRGFALKETCICEKRPTKKTYKRDLKRRPKETYKRDLQRRFEKGTHNGAGLLRRDSLISVERNLYM